MPTLELTESEISVLGALRRLRDDEGLRDIDHALREVAQAVKASHKKGAVNLKVTFTPLTKGGRDVVSVQLDIRKSTPEPAVDERLFFVADNGSLSINDPRQQRIDFPGQQPG